MYSSLFGATKQIYSSEGGISAFYKGLTPSVLQIIPYAGLSFAFYSLSQGCLRKTNLKEGKF